MAEHPPGAMDRSVARFLSGVTPERRHDEALALHDLFAETTGFDARLWGASTLGFGRYHYRYASGREGDHLATGFSPRKAHLAVYIMPGYSDFSDILARLGKHKKGKSCLYFNKLADIDLAVLRELIEAGLEDLRAYWAVEPE